jgi:plastocyanin
MSIGWLMLWAVLIGPPTAKRHTVVMQQFAFAPVVVHAAIGDTIVWENRDLVPHTADANNKSWATGSIAGNGQAITVVKGKGEQEFTCLYHSNMKGKLIVNP